MKDIAIVIPTLKSGGAEKQASLLAKNLSDNYKIHLVVYYGDVPNSKANDSILNKGKNLCVYYLEGNHFSKSIRIVSILRREHIKLVFNYLTLCDCWCSLLERIAGVRYVYNGIRNSRLPKKKLVLERIAHNSIATGTVFNCYSGTEYFIGKGFKKKKCVTIHNCFDDISEPISHTKNDIVKIITVGRFVPQKDYQTAIKIISLLPVSNFHFVIVGYGELENEIRKWVKHYNIEEKTTIYINPKHTQELLRAADIYLSTSLFEGTSNSIMEAMNWSLPVVATNVGDNKYLIYDGKNGFLHELGDMGNMVKSLSMLIRDNDLRNTMGVKGNNILREKFSEKLFEQKYRNLIEQKNKPK